MTTRLSLCFRSVKWVYFTVHLHCYDGRRPHSLESNENELWSENPLTVSQCQPLPFKLLSCGFRHSWERRTQRTRLGTSSLGRLHLAFEVLVWSDALSPWSPDYGAQSHWSKHLKSRGGTLSSLGSAIPWGPLFAESSLHFSNS